jgi:hypothetical protein
MLSIYQAIRIEEIMMSDKREFQEEVSCVFMMSDLKWRHNWERLLLKALAQSGSLSRREMPA